MSVMGKLEVKDVLNLSHIKIKEVRRRLSEIIPDPKIIDRYDLMKLLEILLDCESGIYKCLKELEEKNGKI